MFFYFKLFFYHLLYCPKHDFAIEKKMFHLICFFKKLFHII